MPFYHTPAVILDCEDFGELDKKTTLFTRDFGKIKGIAKGAKKSKKRFGANLDLFAYVDVMFFEGYSTLVRIEEASFIQAYRRITQDMVRFSYASYLIQLVDEMTRERQKEASLLEQLVYFLALLDDGMTTEDMLRVFEIRLLGILGLKPRLDVCLRCGHLRYGKKPNFFSVASGGMLCGKCGKVTDVLLPISRDTSEVLQFAQKLELESLKYLSFSTQALSESGQILPAFIQYHLGKTINAGNFLSRFRP